MYSSVFRINLCSTASSTWLHIKRIPGIALIGIEISRWRTSHPDRVICRFWHKIFLLFILLLLPLLVCQLQLYWHYLGKYIWDNTIFKYTSKWCRAAGSGLLVQKINESQNEPNRKQMKWSKWTFNIECQSICGCMYMYCQFSFCLDKANIWKNFRLHWSQCQVKLINFSRPQLCLTLAVISFFPRLAQSTNERKKGLVFTFQADKYIIRPLFVWLRMCHWLQHPRFDFKSSVTILFIVYLAVWDANVDRLMWSFPLLRRLTRWCCSLGG